MRCDAVRSCRHVSETTVNSLVTSIILLNSSVELENIQGLVGGVSAYSYYQVCWGSKSDVACVYTAVGHSDQIVIDCV